MLNDMARHINKISKDILGDLKETNNHIMKVGGGMKLSKQ